MPGTLTHTTAEIIRKLLVDLGLGQEPVEEGPNPNWPVYATMVPPKPDNVITVLDTDGVLQGREMVTGEQAIRHGFQILLRSSTHALGGPKANAIAITLDAVYGDTVTVGVKNYYVQSIGRTTDVIPIGRESDVSQRRMFSINGLVTLRELDVIAPTVPQQVSVLVNGSITPTITYTASHITGILVRFNQDVSIESAAFTLTNVWAGSSGEVLTSSSGRIVVTTMGRIAILTFTPGTGVNLTSLADGIWTLATDMSKVSSTDGLAGSGVETVLNIRRYFGDYDGDGDVDSDDFLEFSSRFNTGLDS